MPKEHRGIPSPYMHTLDKLLLRSQGNSKSPAYWHWVASNWGFSSRVPCVNLHLRLVDLQVMRSLGSRKAQDRGRSPGCASGHPNMRCLWMQLIEATMYIWRSLGKRKSVYLECSRNWDPLLWGVVIAGGCFHHVRPPASHTPRVCGTNSRRLQLWNAMLLCPCPWDPYLIFNVSTQLPIF